MSVTLVLIIILLLSIGILIKLICDNKSSEIEKLLNQLKLLTTSNLIVWTKQEHDFYYYKVIVYHTVTKIGSFAIKIWDTVLGCFLRPKHLDLHVFGHQAGGFF